MVCDARPQVTRMYKDAHGGSDVVSKQSFVRVGLHHELLGYVALKHRTVSKAWHVACVSILGYDARVQHCCCCFHRPTRHRIWTF